MSRAKKQTKPPGPRAQDSVDRLIAWFAKNRPDYAGELHVTLSDDTLRKFARRATDKQGNVIPGLWRYGERTLRQHHAVKPRADK